MILEDSTEAYKVAIDFLKDGKIVIIPGVSNYSLAVNALDANAIKRLYDIKKRPYSKPITLLLPPNKANRFIEIPKRNQKALLLMGDPIVLIGKARKDSPVSNVINSNTSTLGISWLNIWPHKLLYRYASFPIAGSSLNISGEPIVATFEEVIEKFDGKVDLIIKEGDCPHQGREASVLDISADPPLLVRRGFVDEAIIKCFFPDLVTK